MEEILETTEIEKYTAYKDSGEDWIGEIPEHWEAKKLKLIFYEKKMKSNPKLNCGSISFGNVVTKDDEKILLSTKASYQEVLKGDFLINPLNLNYDLISLRIALSYIDVVVSSGYIVIKPKTKLDKEYFKFLLHRYDVSYMKLLGSGVRQTINFNHIANSLLPFPPFKEQNAIASFLNRKTALIDQAIGIKEKQIELLKERRQILTHQAVTRGLNPTVKMKDSGVEWIGEVPEHWEVKRMKDVALINPSIKYAKEIETASFIPMEAVGEYGGLDTSIVRPIKEIKKGFTAFMNNDVIIAKITPCYENYKGAIAKNLYNGIAFGTTELHVLRSKEKIKPEFIFKITQSPYFRNLGTGMMYGSGGQKRIGTDFISTVVIPCPSIFEQDQILYYIYITSERMANAICIKEKEIEKLKEYKSTLINSAVTGKIKISN